MLLYRLCTAIVLTAQKGQKYDAHHDYFSFEGADRNGGNRLCTVLMYLTGAWGWGGVGCVGGRILDLHLGGGGSTHTYLIGVWWKCV